MVGRFTTIRRPWFFAAIAVISVSAGLSATQEAWRLVALLQDRTERDSAACQLLELGLYRSTPRYTDKPCERISGAVNHVVVAHQEPDPPVYVVFRRPSYDADGVGPGLPKGPFTLFDSEGYIIPVFSAANLLGEDDDLFAYAGNSRLAIAHLILHGASRDAPIEWTTQVLHIVPITPLQQSVLSVIVGPPTYGFEDGCDGVYWGWRRADQDDDRIPEIEIGPFQNREGDILPRAAYRWSVQSEQYEGPSGSVEEGFLRVDTQRHGNECCPYYTAIEQFALARHQLPTPGDPTAVRRSRCDTVGPYPK
jgi:hypothetical protein